MLRGVAAGLVALVGCSAASADSISVVDSREDVPDACRLVGAVPIGIADPPESPEALEPDLLKMARRIAREWDGHVLVFRAIVEKASESAEFALLKCDCEVYRCATGAAEEPVRVPLATLLASPGPYEGQLVIVTARVAFEHELAALILEPDEQGHLDAEKAVEIDGPESLFRELPFPYCGQLEVVGRFSRTGSLKIFGGHLAVHRMRRLGSLAVEKPPDPDRRSCFSLHDSP
ncbi:MAG TPA: hypothetical protein VFY49_06620 [Myxococcota bacterium]|nr:hypothetical protein [Myxococcota bacterium]